MTMANDESDKTQGPPKRRPDRKALPAGLQNIVNKAEKEDNFYDELYDGKAPDSTESNIRYAAYASRIRTALMSAQRYVAYTSDIGESFRPVAHPYMVRSAYGISWAYLIGDVANEGYKAYCQNQQILHPELPREAMKERYNDAEMMLKVATNDSADLTGSNTPGKIAPLNDYRTVMVQRAIFQSIASMGLPAFTIHSIVKYSGRALKDAKNTKIRTYGPIGLGLAVLPALPFVFDKPVEEVVEWVFHKGFEVRDGNKEKRKEL